MPRLSKMKIRAFARIANDGHSPQVRGKALEDLVCYLFESIPGVEYTLRNTVDFSNSGEIDVVVANTKVTRQGLHFLPPVILAECKNWAGAVGSQEIRVLADRMKERACDVAVLIATNGVTGDPHDLTSANNQIARALENRYHILVISMVELQGIKNTEDLVNLLKMKFLRLKAYRTSF
jgi:hypothetical protein